jgi:hypothetical protein
MRATPHGLAFSIPPCWRRNKSSLKVWIKKKSPLFWAGCYAGTFGLFGVLYLLISYWDVHSFYQSTSRYERRYRDDQTRIARDLQSDIRRVLKLTVGSDRRGGGYEPVVENVTAHHLRVQQDQSAGFLVTFFVDVPVIDERLDRLRYSIRFTVAGTVDDTENANLRVTDYFVGSVEAPPNGGKAVMPPAERVHSIAVGDPLWSIFRTGEVPAISSVPGLTGLVEEAEGWPSVELGNYAIRMFYLSAVTITTTGFGDILPLTTLTRFLTGLEALLGTFWFGLFLYALPQRSGQERPFIADTP